jgi:hypothetical protein
LCGNDPLSSSLLPDKSTVEIRITPAREAPTPKILAVENRSIPNREQKIRVQTLLVDVRIVTLATLVYSRQADAK